MLGERKSDIFKLIPESYLPVYDLFIPGQREECFDFAAKIGYPIIAKPDIGERGKLVEKINSPEELKIYIDKCPVPFLLQEFVDMAVELGVFYVRYPEHKKGRVTSLVRKQFMTVTGTGKDTVRDLLAHRNRALLQLDLDHPRFRKLLEYRPERDEKVLVEPIGNHCRGTVFLDEESEIDQELSKAFDTISGKIDGFYFGRYDLRCRSIDSLKRLEDFKIIELNGAGAEPGHIYHPGASLWKGYRAIFWHLNVLSQISRANKRRGHTYWSLRKGLKKLQEIVRYNRLIRKIQ